MYAVEFNADTGKWEHCPLPADEPDCDIEFAANYLRWAGPNATYHGKHGDYNVEDIKLYIALSSIPEEVARVKRLNGVDISPKAVAHAVKILNLDPDACKREYAEWISGFQY